MALSWPFREPTGSQHAARGEGKEIKENIKRNAFPSALPIFPTFTHAKRTGKMDYRNLAEAELKRRIATQLFPADAGGNRISKIDFTGAKGARPVRGPKGGRPVRATSGQREDHTGGSLCRVAGDPHVAPVQKTVRLILCGGRAACNALYGRIAMHPNNNGRITLRPYRKPFW